MNLNPASEIVARCSYSTARRRFLGIPYRRYVTIQIVGHGWTQALRPKDIEYMVLDWLICSYEHTCSSDYKVTIEWL